VSKLTRWHSGLLTGFYQLARTFGPWAAIAMLIVVLEPSLLTRFKILDFIEFDAASGQAAEELAREGLTVEELIGLLQSGQVIVRFVPPVPPATAALQGQIDGSQRLTATLSFAVGGAGGANRAFPSAEGFGARATWNSDLTDACNRDSLKVHRVTNTNDSGAGSFRDIIENQLTTDTLDVVVFTTGGTAVGNQVELATNCVIIAGQTAPGGGFQLHNSAGGAVFRLHRNGSASDVVIRYMRFRSDKDAAGGKDVVDINGGNGIIFDHVSTQFGNDEVFTVTGLPAGNGGSDILNVTIQRTIIAAGLRPHSTGGIYKRVEDGTTQTDSLSIIHSLYANNAHRNPRIVGIANAQVINTVIYNWKNRGSGMEAGSTNHPCNIDWVRNKWKGGPWGGTGSAEIIEQDDDVDFCKVFMEANVAETFQTDSTADQKLLCTFRFSGGPCPDSIFELTRRTNPAVPVVEDHAEAAFLSVLADVGASSKLDDVSCDGGFLANMDALDDTIIAHATNGTGPSTDEEADDPADYGGIPTLAAGTACTDADNDGMPGPYEALFAFLSDADATDAAKDNDSDGYTNLEEYLNDTTP